MKASRDGHWSQVLILTIIETNFERFKWWAMMSSLKIKHHWNKILTGSSDGQWGQVSILEYMKLSICTEIAQCNKVKLRSSSTAVKFGWSQVWPRSSLVEVKLSRFQRGLVVFLFCLQWNAFFQTFYFHSSKHDLHR